ncbi:hypothetical protein [Halobiforma nitratireducens]|nr:hypothetical protein [Halobiforma nitratireducens]
MRWGDERGVTVQVGAVLLLAILMTALVMYQLNVVPAENQQIEYNHNERVTGDLIDLRSAIATSGETNTPRPVSIALGSQYETRTFTVNPPHPRGTIESVPADGAVSISGNDITDLDDLETHYLVYEPHYNEYTGAPTTVLEHTLLYNDFEGTNLSVADQMMIGDNSVFIPLVDGDLSESGSGTTAVDVESLEGPQTETIDQDVVIELPTTDTEMWTSGTDLPAGATVSPNPDTGHVTITLDGDVFDEVSIARVGVGGEYGEDQLGDFGESKSQPDPTQTFAVEFDDPPPITEGDEGVELITTVTDNETDEQIENASVDFSKQNNGKIHIDRPRSDERTDEVGEATAVVDAVSSGSTTIYGSSGDSSTGLSLEIEESGQEPGFSALEATAGGNINAIEFAYTPTGGLTDPSIDFAVYDGEDVSGTELDSGTDSNPDVDSENILELDGFSSSDTDPPVTIEVVLTDDNVDVVCTGTITDNTDEISIEDGGIDCTSDTADSEFSTAIDDTNEPVVEGETVEVETIVENTGDKDDTQTVELEIEDHGIVDSTELSLESGESEPITVAWETDDGDADTDIDATVSSEDDSDTVQVTVEAEPDPAFFDVSIEETNSPVVEGQTLEVDATIENTGDETGDRTVELETDDEVRDAVGVELEPGESTTVILEWDTVPGFWFFPGDAGTYDADVQSGDDTDTTTVVVEES